MNLTAPIFNDETAARKHLEAIRWPNGPVCPYCGVLEQSKPLGGKSMGDGWYHCGACRKKFTVRVGSIYERSHIPLHKWVLATHLMAASKKGVSAHQLHRMLGITYKSAWFMAMRIREAMKPSETGGKMGGPGKIVEADETYISRKDIPATKKRDGGDFKRKGGSGGFNKRVIITLVERGGEARSFHVERATRATVEAIVANNVAKETALHTDESKLYRQVDEIVADHDTVRHADKEYVRGTVHTNTIEGFFSIFKRGMRGVYQHCGEQHLHRYLAEFDFRYSNRASLEISDTVRAEKIVKGAAGKRLTYRRSHQA